MNQWKCLVKWCHLALFITLIEEISTTCDLPRELSKYLDDYWDVYKDKFNKTYEKNSEKEVRAVWTGNIFIVYEHNLLAAAGHCSYLLRDNDFADLSIQQYLRQLIKLFPSPRVKFVDDEMVSAVHYESNKVPEYLDWRECGFITPAENQMDCGSCYAYAITGTIEGQIFRNTGQLNPLSIQQIVDCSSSAGNLGCDGGSLRNTLRYLEKTKGVMARSSYQNKGQQGICQYESNKSVINVTSWATLPAGDEKSLEAAVAKVGPIAVSLNASPQTFQLYHSGVYDDPHCDASTVNHAMLVVGYSPTYWILKNWWGTSWGENGYMRLAKNKNRCGIANYGAYAII